MDVRTSHDGGGKGNRDNRDGGGMDNHDDNDDANHDNRHRIHHDGMAYLRQTVLPCRSSGIPFVVDRTFYSPSFSIFLYTLC
jgi:hypothetical protein